MSNTRASEFHPRLELRESITTFLERNDFIASKLPV